MRPTGVQIAKCVGNLSRDEKLRRNLFVALFEGWSGSDLSSASSKTFTNLGRAPIAVCTSIDTPQVSIASVSRGCKNEKHVHSVTAMCVHEQRDCIQA